MTPLDDIVTSRLVLRLMDNEIIAACLAGDLATAERLLGVTIPCELLDHPSSLRYGQQQLKADSGYLPWSARAIILPDERLMIGLVRFHSRPDPVYLHPYARGAVEFGYRIFSDYRSRGYATEAVTAVMNWAQSVFGVSSFVASISPENEFSLRLIAKIGFIKVGEVMDDTDGMEYVFLKILPVNRNWAIFPS